MFAKLFGLNYILTCFSTIIPGPVVHLKTRQTRAAGAGFSRVVTCLPAPAPVATRTRNPRGFINPRHSLPAAVFLDYIS
jgi:hypothetical protein